jgi:hypothetical protein
MESRPQDSRTKGTLDTMSDALFEEFRNAVDAYERDAERP